MLIAGRCSAAIAPGAAMADSVRGDFEEADEIIGRSVADLQLAGVSGSAIAGALHLRSIMLWRKEGYTDDEIVCEFGRCIQLPFGRTPPRRSTRAGKSEGPT